MLVRGWAFANSVPIPILPHPESIIKLHKAVFSHHAHTQTGFGRRILSSWTFLVYMESIYQPHFLLCLMEKLTELKKTEFAVDPKQTHSFTKAVWSGRFSQTLPHAPTPVTTTTLPAPWRTVSTCTSRPRTHARMGGCYHLSYSYCWWMSQMYFHFLNACVLSFLSFVCCTDGGKRSARCTIAFCTP